MLADPVGEGSYLFTFGCFQVFAHFFIIRKNRTGGSYLGAHITNCSLARRAHAIGAIAKIFDNRPGTSFYSQLTGHPENNILTTGPAAHFASQFYPDQFRHF